MAGVAWTPRGRLPISSSRILTLKCRSDFQSVRQGSRYSLPAFVLEARQRVEARSESVSQARFGFTVTKRIGGAVERNRIRRRLKAAVNSVQKSHARPDFDYVLIARRASLESPFEELVESLVKALDHIHRAPQRARPPRRRPDRKQG